MMKKILFVCLGNICRSPMAEYILRDMAQKRGIAVNVASAGTSGWHDGEYMHCGTAEILDSLSIESRDFRSRKIPADALQYYDYVIVMDDNNLRDVQAALGNDKRIFKITDLLGEGSLHDHVPDPWYTGNFVETREIISACCRELLDRISDQRL